MAIFAPSKLQKTPNLSPPKVEFLFFQGSSTLVMSKTSSVIRESTYNHLPALLDLGTFSKRPVDIENGVLLSTYMLHNSVKFASNGVLDSAVS